MRPSPLVLLASVALGASCARGPDPDWARTPEGGARGDATIAGTPARLGRFAAPPQIDGRLDDAAWRAAAVLGPLVDPGEGADIPRSPVAAFAKLGWDDAKLYLGVVVRDGDPQAPFTRDADDPHVWGASSAIELMLQPGDPGDNRDYYEIQVDTAGAVFDTRWDDYNFPITGTAAAKIFGHQDWSAHAERAAFISKGRFYSLEIAIPWSAFAAGRVPIPPRAGDVWRLNLYSFRDGQRHSLAWSPIKRQGNFHKSARFGRVQFE